MFEHWKYLAIYEYIYEFHRKTCIEYDDDGGSGSGDEYILCACVRNKKAAP